MWKRKYINVSCLYIISDVDHIPVPNFGDFSRLDFKCIVIFALFYFISFSFYV